METEVVTSQIHAQFHALKPGIESFEAFILATKGSDLCEELSHCPICTTLYWHLVFRGDGENKVHNRSDEVFGLVNSPVKIYEFFGKNQSYRDKYIHRSDFSIWEKLGYTRVINSGFPKDAAMNILEELFLKAHETRQPFKSQGIRSDANLHPIILLCRYLGVLTQDVEGAIRLFVLNAPGRVEEKIQAIGFLVEKRGVLLQEWLKRVVKEPELHESIKLDAFEALCSFQKGAPPS